MSRLKFPQKFAVISLLFIVIIIGILYTLFLEINKDIHFSQKERMGIEYVDALRVLLRDVQLERGLEQALLSGDISFKGRLGKKRTQINEDIKLVDSVNTKYGEILKADKIWNEIRLDLNNIQNKKFFISPQESFNFHSLITAKIISFITYIGDSSYLILDPQIDFYYLADIIINQLPELTERIGQARSLGINFAIKKKIILIDEKIIFTVYSTQIKRLSQKTEHDIKKVFKINANLKTLLESDFKNTIDSINEFIYIINTEIINTKIVTILPRKYFSLATSAINDSFDIFKLGSEAFQKQLDMRINKLMQEKYIILVSIISILLLAMYLFVAFYLYFINTLSNLIQTSERVANGDFSVRIKINTNDEMNELITSLNTMTKNLDNLAKREQLTREILVTTITTLDIKEILSTIVSQTGKFFNADRCFYMTYANETKEFLPIEKYEVYLSSPDIKGIAGVKYEIDKINILKKLMFDQKQIAVIDNTSNSNIDEYIKNLMKEYNVKTTIKVPIFYMEKPLGTLTLHYTKENKVLSAEDLDLLSAIANQSAIVIHQAQLYNQIIVTGNREKLLRSIILELLESENLEVAVKSISSEIGKLFNADRATLRFYDPTKKVFTNIVGEYKKNELISSTVANDSDLHYLTNLYTEQIFKTKEIIIIDNIENEIYPDKFRAILKKLKIKSAIIAPIFYKEEALGIIIVSNTESYKTWKIEDIDLLIPVIQQFAIGIHLFSLNERLKKALNNERILNEIIGEVRKYEDPDAIYNLLLSRIINIYNVKRVLHLHSDDKHNLYVYNEVISGNSIKSILHQIILSAEYTEELNAESSSVRVINDVNSEVKNLDLKSYLLSNGIQAYMSYLSPTILQEYGIIGITLTCSSVPRRWLPDEVDLFGLIIDSASLVYLEAKRRQEIEDIRKTFIATLTHDLRSPIYAEQKALEFMLSRKSDDQLKDYFEYLEEIYRTNEELLRIVGNILAIYHYESGKFELNIESAQIEDIVNESIDTLIHFAKYEGSEINVDVEQNLPMVNADKNEIARVIKNLVSNAIKHNQKGTDINIKVRRINNEVEIAVNDNGKGISESEKPNIFQRYPTAKRRIGTGLGLYLSKQIIDAHKGRIWFESEVGKGTTFYFTLNIA
ncbi:MAG: ATP-binding protein [Candidatus Gastranaerophilales bacterium]|nr:ATP-binding protein [Candidatus Gastranaerophilales bacterium]